ncbi:MAG TPA: lipopolysaccharide heptosyltransferase II [Bacteroidota bacterium]|jgi:lipopolysaccharide heptosyltransferase II|nr:lipopolysaccharide heptosyltransferase II [Bacteroidota bacterium]
MQAPEKILIVRFSSIGDIVLASPLMRSLRTAFPEARIDFLVKSEYAELVRHNPNLSSIIELNASGRDELRRLKEQIHAERYDVILDLHNSLRSKYIRFFSGAKSVRVVNKHAVARLMLVRFKRRFYPKPIPPVAERYLETASGLGVVNDGKGLEVVVPYEQATEVASLMSKYSLDKYSSTIGFVPSSKHFTKRWPAGKFVELGIELAAKENVKVLIFGGKEDVEYCGDIAQMINARAGRTAAESVAGKFSLLETAAAFDACHLVVTNDTGLMHVAAARKKKVVAIFGSTVEEFGFFPYGTEYSVVQRDELPCRPCTHVGLASCPRGHFRCMKDIQATEVFKSVQMLLAKESTNTSANYA